TTAVRAAAVATANLIKSGGHPPDFSALPSLHVIPFTLLHKDKKQETPGQITQSTVSAITIYCRH
ncbi:TPA: hypothetical protein ACNGYZ_002651, partial [Raoultella planticola]